MQQNRRRIASGYSVYAWPWQISCGKSDHFFRWARAAADDETLRSSTSHKTTLGWMHKADNARWYNRNLRLCITYSCAGGVGEVARREWAGCVPKLNFVGSLASHRELQCKTWWVGGSPIPYCPETEVSTGAGRQSDILPYPACLCRQGIARLAAWRPRHGIMTWRIGQDGGQILMQTPVA
nr:hypothetical protein CFP56_11169 [Quercus suber]